MGRPDRDDAAGRRGLSGAQCATAPAAAAAQRQQDLARVLPKVPRATRPGAEPSCLGSRTKVLRVAIGQFGHGERGGLNLAADVMPTVSAPKRESARSTGSSDLALTVLGGLGLPTSQVNERTGACDEGGRMVKAACRQPKRCPPPESSRTRPGMYTL